MYVNGVEVHALVDSGSSVTFVNRRLVPPDSIVPGRPVRIVAFDGTSTTFTHWTSVALRFEAREITTHALAIGEVPYDLLLSRPDMKRLRLNIHWDDTISVAPEANQPESVPEQCSKFHIQDQDDVAKYYPELISVSGYPSATSAIQVPFQLSDTTPVRRKPYNMTRDKKEWLKKELQQMLDAGIIRPSTSTFASPITIAPKADGSFRLCTDFRMVNKQTDMFPFPMPHVDDIISDTGGSSTFSTIDLCKGFWQVPLTEDTKQYTAFVTPLNLYEYNRLPFGWKNSSAWFQKMMTTVLEPFIGKFAHVYIDDILIYSRNHEEHCHHLQQVLDTLSRANLKVNLKKSVFFRNEVVFLGRVFDGKTKTTKEESVKKIQSMRKPNDSHSLRVFLGLAGHFRAFIQDYAKRTKCLTALLQKDTSFEWTGECEDAYVDIVNTISSNPVLTIPDFSLPFELHTDASQYGTGAVLYQRDESKPPQQQYTVIGYQSYTFSKAEINYCTTEKELLAVLQATRYFCTYLDGRPFKLCTDHQPVVSVLTSAELKGRLARWVSELQQLEMDVEYRPGSVLTDADALSRLALDHAAAASFDDTLMWEGTENLQQADGRFLVPPTMRAKILAMYHDSPESGGHDGVTRTYRKLCHRFTWPKMKQDVKSYVRSCETCQRCKVKFRQRTDVMVLPEHSRIPFEVVHLDFAELRKKSEGIRRTQSFLLAVDEATRMVFTRPGGEDTNSVVSMLQREAFTSTKVIVCDNGPGFRSKRMQAWAQQNNVCIKFAAPYHPAANGMAERAIRDIKQFIHMYPDFPGGWRPCLEAATQHHNRAYNSAIGCSPHFALHGRPPLLKADQELGIADAINVKERRKSTGCEKQYRNSVKKYFDRRHNPRIPDIQVGDLVLVRKGLPGAQMVLLGPFTVLQTAKKQGILKTIGYTDDTGRFELATIANVYKYHPRRDGPVNPRPM